MKKLTWILVCLQLTALSFGQCTQSETLEKLLALLTKKGVITAQEAEGLVQELHHTAPAVLPEPPDQTPAQAGASSGSDTAGSGISSGPPATAGSQGRSRIQVNEAISLFGDLRLRYDTQRRTVDIGNWDRRRPRFRLRFGTQAQLLDSLKVGFRLVSGSGFQNTTNQSFDGHGRGDMIFIDRVYADWKPARWFQVYGGKHKNIFGRTPLVWDTDVNLVGSSQRFVYPGETVRPFANFTQYIIEELNLKATSNADPIMFGYQGGIEADLGEDINLESVVSFYDYRYLDLLGPGGIGNITTFVGYNHNHGQQMIFNSEGRLLNEFRTLELGAKIRFKHFRYPFSFFGHWIRNTAADIEKLRRDGVKVPGSDPARLEAYGDDNRGTGYQFGLEWGCREKKGDLFLQYFYQALEDYAFPAVFVDSDFHGGGTNNRGHRLWTRYFLVDNVYLQGLVYFSQRDREAKDGRFDENRVQLDVIFDF